MFGVTMSEATTVEPVTIEGVSHEAFLQLLVFLYTGDVACASEEEYHDLFIVSDKFQVDALKALCEQYLLKRITANSAVSFLPLSQQHNATELKSSRLKFIVTYWNRHSFFNESNREILRH
jgi:speckle-type POZ protein